MDSSDTTSSSNDQSSTEELPVELDPHAIKNLRAMLGNDSATMFPVLIESFNEDMIRLMKDAHTAIEAGQAHDLHLAAHTLKSNSRSFGATHLADIASKLEDLAKAGQVNGATEFVDEIEIEYTKVRVALEALREGSE